jgi:hypothetical protein
MNPLAQSWRVLVVANETVASEILLEAIDLRGRGAEVLVVAPALNSRLAFWSSDEDRARRRAGERLCRCLAALAAVGVDARGAVGDANPLLAIEDALRTFSADEIIVATHPEGRSNWLSRDVVARARARFAQPVHHIVVDASAGRHFVAA